MENEFAALMRQHKEMIRFIMEKSAAILGWRMPKEVFLQPIMSSDEVQKLNLLNQMASAGGLPFGVVHERLGLNSVAVFDDMLKEQKLRSDQEAELMKHRAKLGLVPQPAAAPPGAAGQPAPGEEGAPGEGAPAGDPGQPMNQLSGSYQTSEELLAAVPPEGADPSLVEQILASLEYESPLRRALFLQRLAQRNPALQQEVVRAMNPNQDSVDLPLPEQRPPRRAVGV
jgi:hypothetical protein